MHLRSSRLLTLIVAVCALAACTWAMAADTEAKKMEIPNLPAHPRLLMNAKGIADMKSRVQNCDWAKAQWESLKKRADGALDKTVELPPRGSTWFHYYACPVHGCGLQRGKQIGPWQWEHICPVGKEILKSDPSKPETDYDGYPLANIHGNWADDVVALGVTYQMTGDARYSAKARDILLAYADKYLKYPLHNIDGAPKIGGGRVGPQTLDESVWLIPICQGADMVWDTLSQADKDRIANGLLLPAAKEVILPHVMGIHNIQNWKNGAVGLVGLLLDDKDLIRSAIYDPKSGFEAQVSQGVTADGQWWEGAWGYHFYTMSAMWGLTEAARNCGIDLYCPEYKWMFDGPLKLASPSMHLPAFNDSGEVDIQGQAPIYELAYARYKDPLCLELLSKSDRHNDFALYFGEQNLPSPPKAKAQSKNYPGTGYAILAKGKGEQATWLCLKYGPHGGGHGHPDKLSFVVCARGKMIAIDPGTSRYGLPMHAGWHKTTLAHSTLTVDEESQKPAEGRCIAFGTEDGVDYAVCNGGDIYDGVSFTRTVAMLDENLIVFIDQIKSDKEHTFDLAYHQRGKWSKMPDAAAWTPPDKHGYSYLRNAVMSKAEGDVTLECNTLKSPTPALNEDAVAVQLAAGEPTEVITATGIGSNTEDRVPVAIFRRHGKDTVYVWSLSLDGKPARIKRLDAKDGVAVAVTSAGGKKWNLTVNPDAKPAFAVK